MIASSSQPQRFHSSIARLSVQQTCIMFPLAWQMVSLHQLANVLLSWTTHLQGSGCSSGNRAESSHALQEPAKFWVCRRYCLDNVFTTLLRVCVMTHKLFYHVALLWGWMVGQPIAVGQQLRRTSQTFTHGSALSAEGTIMSRCNERRAFSPARSNAEVLGPCAASCYLHP